MASRIRIISRLNAIVVEFWEELSTTEMTEFEQAVSAAVGDDTSDMDLLLVIHAGCQITLTSKDLRSFARHRRQFSPDSRRVIITTEELSFGLARMYASEAYEVSDRFSIFHDIPSALAFLEIDPQRVDLKFSDPGNTISRR